MEIPQEIPSQDSVPPEGQTQPPLFSVSEINRDARRLLETHFPEVRVEGEVSNFSCPASGHWYFSLKDESAQLRCVMFRGENRQLNFRPKDGEAVLARGRISLYEGRGTFQLVATYLEKSREGELHRRFEELKRKLQEEGLFDAQHKKPLPPHPRHIAIVSSLGAAALQDVLRVCGQRLPILRISVCPATVQGDAAVGELCAALELANRYQDAALPPLELILLTRGGGSLEDLQAFNEEALARAIFHSRLPVVSAVGHETDVSIADFVADLRAPTPSAAAALVTPDRAGYYETLGRSARQLRAAMDNKLHSESLRLEAMRRGLRNPRTLLQEQAQRLDRLEEGLRLHVRAALGRPGNTLEGLGARLRGHSPLRRVREQRNHLGALRTALERGQEQLRRQREGRLQLLSTALRNISPWNTLQRGYAILEDEAGRILRDAGDSRLGALVRAQLARGRLVCRVEQQDTTPPEQSES